MIQPEISKRSKPFPARPIQAEGSRWVPFDRGPNIARPGFVAKYAKRTCPTAGCIENAGFEDSPLCEECSWNLVVKLEKAKERDAAYEAAKARHKAWEDQQQANYEAARIQRAKEWQEVTTKRAGWIYYLHIGDLIKIGYTIDLDQRRKQYPPNSKLLAVHPGTLKTEKQMHSKFFNSLSRGREWFTPTPDLIEHIEDARKQFKRDDLDAIPA